MQDSSAGTSREKERDETGSENEDILDMQVCEHGSKARPRDRIQRECRKWEEACQQQTSHTLRYPYYTHTLYFDLIYPRRSVAFHSRFLLEVA